MTLIMSTTYLSGGVSEFFLTKFLILGSDDRHGLKWSKDRSVDQGFYPVLRISTKVD